LTSDARHTLPATRQRAPGGTAARLHPKSGIGSRRPARPQLQAANHDWQLLQVGLEHRALFASREAEVIEADQVDLGGMLEQTFMEQPGPLVPQGLALQHCIADT